MKKVGEDTATGEQAERVLAVYLVELGGLIQARLTGPLDL
jgi:hypothetical protein